MLTHDSLLDKTESIAVVGLGYVGLPLAYALSPHYNIIGFDINKKRVDELSKGIDVTDSIPSLDMQGRSLAFTSEQNDLAKAKILVVTVPTPIDEGKKPDLTAVFAASRTVAENMPKGAIIVYESTVFPGCTEELCGPIIEKHSGYKCGTDFFLGYSPERINPGDQVHTVEHIVKLVAGQTPEVTELLAQVYGSIIKAGVHKTSSIKVAEAAKVIENTQRDLNIALMNELSQIFARMDLDTLEVLEAAGTKWNFLPFRPGLVGGHCIGVDPYYLTYKAEAMGIYPRIVLAGRQINDAMGGYVAENAVKLMIRNDLPVKRAKVGVLGITFKENVPDIRNSRVIDVIQGLNDYGVTPLIHDPLADAEEVRHEYGVDLTSLEDFTDLDVLILAVPHKQFADYAPKDLAALYKGGKPGVLLDIKGLHNRQAMEEYGFAYWRL